MLARRPSGLAGEGLGQRLGERAGVPSGREDRNPPLAAGGVGAGEVVEEDRAGPTVEHQMAGAHMQHVALRAKPVQAGRHMAGGIEWRGPGRRGAQAFAEPGFRVRHAGEVLHGQGGHCGRREHTLARLFAVEGEAEGRMVAGHIGEGRLQGGQVERPVEREAEGLVEGARGPGVEVGGHPALGLAGAERRPLAPDGARLRDGHGSRRRQGGRALHRGAIAARDEALGHQLVEAGEEHVADPLDHRLVHGVGDEMTELLVEVQAVEAGKVVEQADETQALVPVQAPQAGAVHRPHRGIAFGKALVEPVDEALGAAVEAGIQRRAFAPEVFQCGLRCGQGQRMAHEGAGEIGDTGLGVALVAVAPEPAVERVHPGRAAGDGGQRQAAADDLAVGAEVGAHAVEGLGAAGAKAETGDHLVEDQGAAAGIGDLAQGPDEGMRLQGRELVLHRLDHDRRQFVRALAQHPERLLAGVVEHQHVLHRRGEDAGSGGQRA